MKKNIHSNLFTFFVTGLLVSMLFFSCETTDSVSKTTETQQTQELETEQVPQENPTPTPTEAEESSDIEEEPTVDVRDSVLYEPEEAIKTNNTTESQKNMNTATHKAGFELLAPDSLLSYNRKDIRVEENQLIEFVYANDQKKTICVRKAFGCMDISGDFTNYSDSRRLWDSGLSIFLRGTNGNYKCAAWESGDYSFFVGCSEGLSQTDMLAIVKVIN